MRADLAPWLIGRALGLLGAVWGATGAHAAPFVPAHDDEVVERLAAQPDATQRARKAALARDPQQWPLALAAAQDALQRARQDGDPRELGVAQAALAPWWQDAKAPPAVRLLRATILQSQHAFKAALLDLDQLVNEAPRLGAPGAPGALGTSAPWLAQALLTRASLHQGQGRLVAAQTDCQALKQVALTTRSAALMPVAEACLIELQSLTGDPQQARIAMDALAAQGRVDPWLSLLRAELAERLGDDVAAPIHFQAASADGAVYPLAAYADWLLDREQNREALAVLQRGALQSDALMLRRAIAWHRLGDARAQAAVTELRARMAAVRLRGDAPHWREEARLALDIDLDAPRALALARRQWAEQKEPADAVLLWRAGRGIDAAGVARELRQWIANPARADVRLAAGIAKPTPLASGLR